MKIDELTQAQKESFCHTMAGCGFYEETDYGYRLALDFLDIKEPDDENFDYTDGLGAELYQEVEEAMTMVMYLRLIFVAIYNPENFDDFSSQNKGYEFAIDKLSDLQSISSDEEFEVYLDSIADA
tara:strand:+ start:64 stop:438 length:375 start_codon:yes stop_codon:yes gene_type:complete